MQFRMLIASFRLIVLYSIAMPVEAGSSATAITTISANIVPAASFTVSSPILLNQRLPDRQSLSTDLHQDKTSKSTYSNGMYLKTTDTGSPTKLSVVSSNNLVYDVSLSSQISATDKGSNISANIRHTLEDDGHLNTNEEYKLKIDGSLMDITEQDTGAFRGLIDITVNYN